MASWDDPSNSNPAHTNVLSDLAAKDSYALTMGQTATVYTELPVGTMTADNSSKIFRRRDGGVAEPFVISLAGGGTGATDAAGARTVLQVNKTGTGSAEARTNAQNDTRYTQLTRVVNTTSPLTGGGALSSDLTIAINDASTSAKGAVQLDNTLTSTSTTKALTAAQGKVLKDAVDAVIDIGFYQEETLGPSFLLTSGSCKVVRVGNMVCISGRYGHALDTDAYSDNIVPSWALPAGSHSNAYSVTSTKHKLVSVTGFGQLSFNYGQTEVSTSYFSISYTV